MAPTGDGENGSIPEPPLPQDLRRLHTVELGEADPALRSAAAPIHNLPLELSSFVGRGKELAEVKRLLMDNRLLTLTGSGGCGKTRLALAAAAELGEGVGGGGGVGGMGSVG